MQRTWDHPEGVSFENWTNNRMARFSIRRYDRDALKFQADSDPKYRRAQMRYLGTGGAGVAADTNTVPARHFTFSTMVTPTGHKSPSHLHTDVEEVLFIIRDKLKLALKRDNRRYETTLTDHDLVPVPPGVYREEINIGDEGVLMCVMLGAKKPITPTYPPEHPLAKIKR